MSCLTRSAARRANVSEGFNPNQACTGDGERSGRTSSLSEMSLHPSSYASEAAVNLSDHSLHRKDHRQVPDTNSREGRVKIVFNASDTDADISWYATSQPAEALTRDALLMATPKLNAVFKDGMQTLEAFAAQRLQHLAATQPSSYPTTTAAASDNAVRQEVFASAMQQCSDSSGASCNPPYCDSDIHIAIIEDALRLLNQTHVQRAELFHQLMTRSSQFHHKFVQAVNQTLCSSSPMERKLAAHACQTYTTDLQQHIHHELRSLCQTMSADQVSFGLLTCLILRPARLGM